MASVQARNHSDGTTTYRVRWRDQSRDRSLTFADAASAEAFRANIDRYGPGEALRIIDVIDSGAAQMTLAAWLSSHADTLTGVEPGTRARYHRYIANDFADIGTMPITAVTDTTVARWVNALEAAGASGKTIANKHGFLAGALNHAVRAGKITRNPCDHTRLPRKDSDEMVFLTPPEFELLHDVMTPRWQPLTRWLVATGTRFSEATALLVGDIDSEQGTARINKAWKYTGTRANQRMGTTKTRKGQRTINVPASVIGLLDLDRGRDNLLFPTRSGTPVSAQLYHNKAWRPALARVTADDADPRLDKKPRPHDLRHTCASWMIAAGIPLPVIQAHLGHESIQTTVGVYGHLDRTSGKQAAAALDGMLRGN